MFISRMHLWLLLVLPAATQAQTASWVPVGNPFARCCSGFTYDGATQTTLLFGGANGPTIFGDTWTWRGVWIRRFPTTSPSARQGQAMAYDAAAGDIVLFGGSTTAPLEPGSSLGDTWTWDGTTWTQQFPSVSPPARTWSSMAYLPATKTVVLFGGNNLAGGDGAFSDTWTWDGIAKAWTQQNPANHPTARATNQLVYDLATQNIVLFGGVTTNLTNLNDTWTWDGTNWTRHFPAASPAPRNGPSVAYDAGLRAAVLFGGAAGVCCADSLNDTWTWNGLDWTQIHPANALPASRNAANMDYDPVSKGLVLFGGNADGAVFGDTWLLALAP